MSRPWAYPEPVALGAPRDRGEDPPIQVIDGAALEADLTLRAQVVVVGSGAGGAVCAARLAEAGLDVVLLEQGRRFTREDFHRSHVETLLEAYEGGSMTAVLGRPGIALPYGRALGGTTVINSGTCFRLPERVHAQWVAEGLRELDQASLAPYYAKVEAEIHVGPVTAEIAGKNALAVQRGAERLGLKGGFLARNARGCVGSGRCAFGCPSGAKQSMDRSYLPRASAAGARIYTRVGGERLLLSGGRARGVWARTLGPSPRALVVEADEVVLACGAIGTPLFLERNGLGGGPVGRHLHVHPAAKTYARLPEATSGPGVPQSYFVDELHDEGVMLEGAYVPPELSSSAVPFFGRPHAERMNDAERLGMFGIMVTDSGEGRVRAGLGQAPLITYRLAPRDVEAFKKGILLCARIFLAAGADEVYPSIPGFDVVRSDDDLTRLAARAFSASDLELLAFHPMGTCRMGVDPRQSVVSPDLAVHGISGLWISDASVIPTSIGVNPQLTIMALAERGAERIAERVSRRSEA